MPPTLHRASALRRLSAAALDGVAAVFSYIFALFVGALYSNIPGEVDERPMLLAFLTLWALYSATEVIFAATPGKRLLGLRILHQNGINAGFWRRLLRWSTKYYSLHLSVLLLFLSSTLIANLAGLMNTVLLIGLLGALNDDRLTWHDEWSGTAVFKRKPMPPPLE